MTPLENHLLDQEVARMRRVPTGELIAIILAHALGIGLGIIIGMSL